MLEGDKPFGGQAINRAMNKLGSEPNYLKARSQGICRRLTAGYRQTGLQSGAVDDQR